MTRHINIRSLTEEADDAFWRVIVKHFPDATTGDLSIERTITLRMAEQGAIEEWIENNVPGTAGESL